MKTCCLPRLTRKSEKFFCSGPSFRAAKPVARPQRPLPAYSPPGRLAQRPASGGRASRPAAAAADSGSLAVSYALAHRLFCPDGAVSPTLAVTPELRPVDSESASPPPRLFKSTHLNAWAVSSPSACACHLSAASPGRPILSALAAHRLLSLRLRTAGAVSESEVSYLHFISYMVLQS